MARRIIMSTPRQEGTVIYGAIDTAKRSGSATFIPKASILLMAIREAAMDHMTDAVMTITVRTVTANSRDRDFSFEIAYVNGGSFLICVPQPFLPQNRAGLLSDVFRQRWSGDERLSGSTWQDPVW